jgi:uncharacterized membrane protein YoaK (UPF0700 family)
MLTPAEPAPRQSALLAGTLALVAGAIDAFTLLSYDVFTSFMSGNTTRTALLLGQGKLEESGRHFLPIPLFVIGAFAGALLLHGRSTRPFRRLCSVIGVLLAVGLVLSHIADAHVWLAVVIFSLAMGILSCTLTRVGGESLGLGFVSGNLHKLGMRLAEAARGSPNPILLDANRDRLQGAGVLFLVWSCFFLGATLGAAATSHFGLCALLAPIGVLFALAICGPNHA